jgi:hypothetical protein
VFADGEPVTDQRLVVPRGITPIKIRIEAPDHAERTLELVPDRDRELAVELLPKAARPTRPSSTWEPEPDPNRPDPTPDDIDPFGDASPE